VDLCKGKIAPLTGKQVNVVAAGGIYDGRGLAMALSFGAEAAWVGTRFVATTEAGAPKRHKNGVVTCGYDDTIRTLIYTGRPMRVKKTPYIMNWEENRADEIKALTAKGIRPVEDDMKRAFKENRQISIKERMEAMPMLMGQVAASIDSVVPAAEVIDEMMTTCIATLRRLNGQINILRSKL